MFYWRLCDHASEAEECPTSSARDWDEQTAEQKFQNFILSIKCIFNNMKRRKMWGVCSAFLFRSRFVSRHIHPLWPDGKISNLGLARTDLAVARSIRQDLGLRFSLNKRLYSRLINRYYSPLDDVSDTLTSLQLVDLGVARMDKGRVCWYNCQTKCNGPL